MRADMIKTYFDGIGEILEKILKTQSDSMTKTAQALADAVVEGRNIYIFGCSHASIIAQELFYRTGGLAVINPIFAPGLNLDTRPVTMTSSMERVPGYAKVILNSTDIKKDDVLIIHSVSGRNTVPVEMAETAKGMGVYVIALTNVTYSSGVTSRAPSGKRLFEVSDLVIDNCGDFGDAVCEVEGFAERTAASSTVAGACILNAVMAECVNLLVGRGEQPPVFLSANIDGGDEWNAKLLEKYKDNIKYM